MNTQRQGERAYWIFLAAYTAVNAPLLVGIDSSHFLAAYTAVNTGSKAVLRAADFLAAYTAVNT